jgi:hypothetical protein
MVAKKKSSKKSGKMESMEMDSSCCSSKMDCGSGCGSAFYGLGFIGAVIYYIATATGFWVGVLGVLKALVWPVFLVLELLKFIGA